MSAKNKKGVIMKVKYETVLRQIEQINIGTKIRVLVANNTRRNSSPPYYTREGILISKDLSDADYKRIIVNIKGKKFKMALSHDTKWIGEYPNTTSVQSEYAYGIYDIQQIGE